jgi:hypothetical protein
MASCADHACGVVSAGGSRAISTAGVYQRSILLDARVFRLGHGLGNRSVSRLTVGSADDRDGRFVPSGGFDPLVLVTLVGRLTPSALRETLSASRRLSVGSR